MTALPAIAGGAPVRKTLLPYSRPALDDADIAAVTEVLKGEWLTTGPKVAEFEKAFATFTGAKEAVAVNSGTAALHAAMHALGIQEGDEVIVPALTFASSANAAVFQGGTPVFVDVDPETLLIDPKSAEAAITKKTKAIVAVDYAGQPCDYAALRAITDKRKIAIVADACHSVGASDQGRHVGSLADLSAFSFHAVKPLTTGEGGMITTDDPELAKRMRRFRNHALTSDHRERQNAGSWFYEMVDLGFNYRLTDFQCALGLSQLKKLPEWITWHQEVADRYTQAFNSIPGLKPLAVRKGIVHAWHLYVIRIQPPELKATQQEIFQALRAENLGVNVHYIPVHLHPFYRETFGTKTGDCPIAEKAYTEILSLPLFAGMNDQDAADVIAAVEKVFTHYRK
jgi:perosamine synthetase